MSKFEELVLRTLAIVLVPLVVGLAMYVNLLWRAAEEAAPSVNPYVAPQVMWSMVDGVKKSTFPVACEGNRGSGFVFDLLPEFDYANWNFELQDESKSIILTNFHVIENCFTAESPITIELPSKKIVSARIEMTDSSNDIAALSINKSLDPLYAVNYTLDSGYWVMASGSPLDLQSTVTFGNIINIDGNRIYSSASLNRGNSGGPLVDNEGFVIGINTGYRAVAQDINWAVGINALCQKLATCTNPEHGLIHPTEWEE